MIWCDHAVCDDGIGDLETKGRLKLQCVCYAMIVGMGQVLAILAMLQGRCLMNRR